MKRGITDISGQRFGKLIALEPTGESKHGSALWRCICDCGNERIAMLRSLKTRDATSCGCARSRLLDLTGKRFGKLTVVKRDSSKKTTTWLCRCDCGNETFVRRDHLLNGNTRSCGCARIGHGGTRKGSDQRLYRIWHNMRHRCLNRHFVDYPRYGARGITVCEEWATSDSFPAFRDWAFANGYAANLTLDRINNNKGYSPDNCRWATLEQQNSNKRTNRTINGKTVMQWSKAFGLPYNTLRNRLARRGWNPELLVSDYPELSALWTIPYQTETETNPNGE